MTENETTIQREMNSDLTLFVMTNVAIKHKQLSETDQSTVVNSSVNSNLPHDEEPNGHGVLEEQKVNQQLSGLGKVRDDDAQHKATILRHEVI